MAPHGYNLDRTSSKEKATRTILSVDNWSGNVVDLNYLLYMNDRGTIIF